MESVITDALRISLKILFAESVSSSLQKRAIDAVDSLSMFCTRIKSVDIDSAIAVLAGDADVSVNKLFHTLVKHGFGQRYEFMDVVEVFVCTSEDSVVGGTHRHCVFVEDLLDDEKVVAMFEKILDYEIDLRLKVSKEKWSIRSLTSFFKSDCVFDKKIADGFFASRRYHEAYKIYSKYKDQDEFSCYCTEMSAYCLMLCNKRISMDIVNRMDTLRSLCDVYAVRLTIVALFLGMNVLALKLLSSIKLAELFKALVQEELSRHFYDKKGHVRKGIEMAFSSIITFKCMGFHKKTMDRAKSFLDMFETVVANREKGSCFSTDAWFLKAPIEHIKKILDMPEPQSHQTRMASDNIKPIEKYQKERIKISRGYKGSTSDFDGIMNVKESVTIQCWRDGYVSILDVESGVQRDYNATAEIRFNESGSFLIKHATFSVGGIEYVLEVNRPLKVDEDAPFIHVCTETFHEVYCCEKYSFLGRIVRNRNSKVEVMFNGEKFVTVSNTFKLEVIFPSPGSFKFFISVESNGIRAQQELCFVVLPSLSVNLYNYRYAPSLAFLEINNHTVDVAKIISIYVANRGFELSGVCTIESCSLKENAIDYFRENIVGIRDVFPSLKLHGERKIGSEDYVNVFHSMSKSTPITLDVFFRNTIDDKRDEVILPSKKQCFIRILLKKRIEMREQQLNLEKVEDSEDTGLGPSDKLILRKRFEFTTENCGSYYHSSHETILPYEAPIITEVKFSSERTCCFVINGLFNELALASVQKSQENTLNADHLKAAVPFIYVMHPGFARVGEPTIVYLCIRNYYEHFWLSVMLSSHNMIVCDEDKAIVVEAFKLSLFEIRCVFLKEKKYEDEDLMIHVKVCDKEIHYESLVELPFVS